MTDSIFTFRFQKPDEERLDHFLVESLPDYSRARLQALIKDGLVLINGVPAKKSGQMLESDFVDRSSYPAICADRFGWRKYSAGYCL